MESRFSTIFTFNRKAIILLISMVLAYGLLYKKLRYYYTKLQIQKEEVLCKGSLHDVPVVFTHGIEGWRRNKTLCARCFDFPNITLKSTLGNTPMFIYEVRNINDDWVSYNLKEKGVFDPGKLAVIYTYLKMFPNLDFIDMGANIGKMKY